MRHKTSKTKDLLYSFYWWIDDQWDKLPLLIQNLIIYIIGYTIVIGQFVYFMSRPYSQ